MLTVLAFVLGYLAHKYQDVIIHKIDELIGKMK